MNHRKLAYGAILSVGANALKSALLFLLLPVMAKLVGPEQYGLYSIALPAVMFVMAIADAGLGLSLARETDDSSPVWPTAIIALAGLSLSLALILVVYSWVVSLTIGDSRLFAITSILSISVFLTAMTIVPLARLMRNGELTSIAIFEFMAFLIGAGVALALALAGLGVWALVSQSIVTSLCRCILMNLKMPPRFSFAFSMASLRPHMALGGAVGAGRLADFGGRLIEMLVIGKFSSAALTGAFGFGNQVTKFAIEMINNTTWSISFMLALQSTGEVLKENYFRISRVSAMALFPIGGMAAACSGDLIALIMGPEWAPAALLIGVFGPVSALTGVVSMGMAVMYARGVASSPLVFTVELITLRVLSICMLPIFGWEAMIYALGVSYLINSAHGFWMIERRYKWKIGSLILWLLRPAAASLAAAGAYTLLMSQLDLTLVNLVISCAAGGVVYCALLFALDHRRIIQDVTSFYALLRSKDAAAS
ncbi:MAG: oligosaccharide flippase family protein [Beijerinckiaceae bacterium]|nr:oligosaccharide flippase family protein [Beijerinckiaceae bacterium]